MGPHAALVFLNQQFQKVCSMFAAPVELDFIEEIRLRTWARENYVTQGDRSSSWHPIVLAEMRRKDAEEADAENAAMEREELVVMA